MFDARVMKAFVFVSILLLLVSSSPDAAAQETDPQDPPGQQQQEEEREQVRDEALLLSKISFADRAFRTLRSRAGMVFGVSESYNSDSFGFMNERRNSRFTLLSARLFTDYQRRKLHMAMDYDVNYRFYDGANSFRGTSHNASLNLSYQLTRNLSLSLSERAFSYHQDLTSQLLSAAGPISADPNAYNWIYLDGLRVKGASSSAGLNYQVGRRHQMTMVTTYSLYRHDTQDFANSASGSVDFRWNSRLNRWLTLDNGYSVAIYQHNNASGETRVHRLNVGGLSYDVSRHVRMFAHGGVEVATSSGFTRTTGNVQAGIERLTGPTHIMLHYHRGFAEAGGLGSTLTSQTLNLHLRRLLTRRLAVHGWGGYWRGAAFTGPERLESYRGGGGFQVSLRRDLSLVMNGLYVEQKGTSSLIGLPGFSRYSFMLGLHYIIPRLK